MRLCEGLRGVTARRRLAEGRSRRGGVEAASPPGPRKRHGNSVCRTALVSLGGTGARRGKKGGGGTAMFLRRITSRGPSGMGLHNYRGGFLDIEQHSLRRCAASPFACDPLVV